MFKTTSVRALIALSLCGGIVAAPLFAARPAVAAPADKAANLALASKWEAAYKRKDKQALLMILMVPTTDGAALEKRYQWLRGYGPHDAPGTVHPPILFDKRRGSFVPTSYSVSGIKPIDATHWDIMLHENGNYQDEDGRYAVTRIRHLKTTNYKGKWFVVDYYMEENPEDYGFFVDDITDKVTPLGK